MKTTNDGVDLPTLDALHVAASNGEWTAYRLIHADHGGDMSPEEMGEYVKNSIVKSRVKSGSPEVLAIFVQKADGPADVCHVGNGPTSPANAHCIAALHNAWPQVSSELKEARATIERLTQENARLTAEVERMRNALDAIVTVPSGWDGVERIREHARRALAPEDKDKEERRLARRPFWCSFWSSDSSKWEYHGPWWVSGYRFDEADREQSSIVAAVMATDKDDAKRILTAAHDKGHEPVEWRFHREMEPWETPFSDRFRRDHWMKWPWPEKESTR